VGFADRNSGCRETQLAAAYKKKKRGTSEVKARVIREETLKKRFSEREKGNNDIRSRKRKRTQAGGGRKVFQPPTSKMVGNGRSKWRKSKAFNRIDSTGRRHLRTLHPWRQPHLLGKKTAGNLKRDRRN